MSEASNPASEASHPASVASLAKFGAQRQFFASIYENEFRGSGRATNLRLFWKVHFRVGAGPESTKSTYDFGGIYMKMSFGARGGQQIYVRFERFTSGLGLAPNLQNQRMISEVYI